MPLLQKVAFVLNRNFSRGNSEIGSEVRATERNHGKMIIAPQKLWFCVVEVVLIIDLIGVISGICGPLLTQPSSLNSRMISARCVRRLSNRAGFSFLSFSA